MNNLLFFEYHNLKKTFYVFLCINIFNISIQSIDSILKDKYDINTLKTYIKAHNIKIAAYYFPQFHECEENNNFWGEGFTEWTLLNKFQGEVKRPHIDIGYYNMLDYSVRKKQALMAKEYGVDSFCYYHYWFKDKKVMYEGIEKILEDGEPNIPFTFCWANHPWTKTWDGSNHEVLIAMDYGNKEDWIKHYNYLLKFFKHPNYIKDNNCPLLYIWQINDIEKSNSLEMFSLWKELIKKEGFDDLKIIQVLNAHQQYNNALDKYVDGYSEQQPSKDVLINGLPELFKIEEQINCDPMVTYQNIINTKRPNKKDFSRGLFYSFDNTPRRINTFSIKYTNLSYRAFEDLISKTVINIHNDPNPNNNYIFMNSWNEWTEQAMLEPNDIDGYALLDIIKKIFK